MQTQKLSQKLHDQNSSIASYTKSSGFILLFDIRESTARKKMHPDQWIRHITAFYREFDAMINTIGAKMCLAPENIVTKRVGDAVMAFIESPDPNPNFAKEILLSGMGFRRWIHDDPSNFLESMRLKSVTTYVTDVYRFEGDILGTGVDLTFHLEPYSNSTCIVVNEEMADVLELREGEAPGGVRVLKDSKVVKGIGAQTIYVIFPWQYS